MKFHSITLLPSSGINKHLQLAYNEDNQATAAMLICSSWILKSNRRRKAQCSGKIQYHLQLLYATTTIHRLVTEQWLI